MAQQRVRLDVGHPDLHDFVREDFRHGQPHARSGGKLGHRLAQRHRLDRDGDRRPGGMKRKSEEGGAEHLSVCTCVTVETVPVRGYKPGVELVAERAERLDVFLARSVPGQSRSQVARWIAEGGVAVDGAAVRRAGLMLRPGQRVSAQPTPQQAVRLEPEPIPLDVLFEDDRILVVDKPRGLATHPAPSFRGPTLVHALLARGTPLSEGSAPYRPGIVHRLDRQTTGLIVVAKDVPAHRALATQFERREAGRVYAAIAQGRPRWEEVTVELPVGRDPKDRRRMTASAGKPASTTLRAIRPAPGGTLVLAKLATGRTHQVRVHLAALGHPVRGDALYAKGEWAEGPMQLHAVLLRLRHPGSGEPLTVYSPPPVDFMAPVGQAEVEGWV